MKGRGGGGDVYTLTTPIAVEKGRKKVRGGGGGGGGGGKRERGERKDF